MITAYFDDTGTHPDSSVVGFGGIFGDSAVWIEFQARWKAKLLAPLRNKPPLRRFRMTECMARDGEFRGYSEAERDAVIHDFRQIIIDSGAWGYAMVASRRDWTDLMPSRYSQIIGDAEAYCFQDVITRMVKFIDDHSSDADLAIVFDCSPKKTRGNEAHYRQFLGLPARARLAGISFLANEKFVPLQGADMWAWEIFHLGTENLSENGLLWPRKHAHQFFTSGRFEANWCDRASIQRIAQALYQMGLPI